MSRQKKLIIGIIGSSNPPGELREMAFKVGQEIAQQGITLICGGLTGVMAASCQGAKSANGLTIGILPGRSREEANPFVDIPIPTGIGEARNLIIIRSSQVLIAVGGGYGTLSEIAFALKLGIPVIGLKTWELNKISKEPLKIIPAESPESAVTQAIKAAVAAKL